MTSPDPTAGTVGPVFGSQAADNAAWDEVRNALASATPGRISDADLDDLTGAVTPILARLVDSAREAGIEEGRREAAKEIEAVGYSGQPMADYWRGYVAATEKAVSIARGES